ncbi:anthranilate synthase component I [Acetobacter tropicalis]|uniref:Anthranilate synthase component 1 n=1 Tax=Acetobacter tropicalis TaxID=104102 RepID=A0A094ZFM4_9PROT|nr:anthranilate synthase component I [Acetobacter tropicalis]KAA8389589.1 anthranilate synthase component I [Acetobacter tropicalis]KAA8390489.1 anthranilate synthase component I [Acetobacter tropicalis]KGB21396.1 Anthranilate synthase, aminase component [Acetobacter tropicalis]MBC9008480.1 anthranilate synthase component I [Acetobacter tropicalis]MDO8170175.1 anthranilate synthase component I [Acetobacter tropicalis]
MSVTARIAASPARHEVEARWREGKGAVVFSVEPADLLTPVSAYIRLANFNGVDGRYTLLLESVEGGVSRGRYSVIALKPDLIWACHDGAVTLDTNPDNPDQPPIPSDKPALESLRSLIHQTRMDLPEGLPPMIAGLFGYLGYDMVRQMERLPNAPADDLELPEAILMRPGLFAIFDTVSDELILAAPVRPQVGQTANEAWEKAHALLGQARTCLNGALPVTQTETATAPFEAPTSTFTKEEFCASVERIQDYIAAGDAFQVVPSQRFSSPFPLPSLALYRALRRINPAPFLFHLDFGTFSLVGSSPEILVRLRDGNMTVRPLAGTRPRGKDAEEDLRLEQDLLADQKELAEHLMLIDLGRNDVGRVCLPGSVKVTERFVIERFSHVMHISSNVEGRIRPDLEALDALVAAFPAGTLTGAPKIRAMEIIDEIEPTRRATYAGCIGYFGAGGDMDTCIGLRMAVVKDGMMHVQAGCGVVADSVPEAEYEETRQKARAVFRAAAEAVRYANQQGN